MKNRILLLYTIFIGHLSIWLFNQAVADDLHRKIFGEKKYHDSVLMPLLINGKKSGEIDVLYDGPGKYSLNKKYLTEKLGPLLIEEYRAIMQNEFDMKSNEFISISEIDFLGIKAQINESQLYAHLSIPIKNLKSIALTGSKTRSHKYWQVPPDKFSAFLNWDLEKAINFQQDLPQADPLTLTLHPNIFIDGSLLESSHRARWEENDKQMYRQYTRWTKHFLKRSHFVQIGDFYNNAYGGQLSQSLFGIQYGRFSNPDDPFNIGQGSNHEFVVKDKSLVQIYLDEQLIFYENLNAGKYSLKDLLVATGFYKVKILIKDRHGNLEELSFDESIFQQLLRPGEKDFNYYAGMPNRIVDYHNEYEKKISKSHFGFYHRQGINSHITLGLFGQKHDLGNLLGGEWLNILGTGVFQYRPIINQDLDHQFYSSHLLSHTYYFRRKDSAQMQLLIEWVDVYNRSNAVHNREQMNFSYPINSKVTFSLQGERRQLRKLGNDYGVALNLNLRWPNTFYHNLRWQYKVPDYGQRKPNWSIFYFVNVIPLFENTFVNYSTSYPTKSHRTLIQYDSRDNIKESYQMSAGYDKNPRYQAVDLGFNFQGNKFHFDYDQKTKLESMSPSIFQLRFSSSLAYVRNHLVVSAPLFNSWIFIDKEDHLEEYKLQSAVHGSKIDTHQLPAIISLGNFRKSTLSLYGDDLPYGRSLEKEMIEASPTFRSGHYFKVKMAGEFLLKGILVDNSGKPLELVGGLIAPIRDLTIETKDFFTNRKGVFFIEGLKEGIYVLKLPNLNRKIEVQLNNPQRRAVLDLGVLRLLSGEK